MRLWRVFLSFRPEPGLSGRHVKKRALCQRTQNHTPFIETARLLKNVI